MAALPRQYEDFFIFQAPTEDKYCSAAATEGTFGAAAQPEALADMQASSAAMTSAGWKLVDHLLGVPCSARARAGQACEPRLGPHPQR